MARKRTRTTLDRHCGNELTGGSLVQTLTFDKREHPRGQPSWDPKSATRWARAHGYVAPEVVVKPNQFRIRQFDPGPCEYRTVPFGRTGVSGIIEFPRKRRRAPAHVVAVVDVELLRRSLRR